MNKQKTIKGFIDFATLGLICGFALIAGM